MEKVANKRDCPNRKRTWSASNRSEHDGGAGRGGYSGGAASGPGKQHKKTDRSRKWPEVATVTAVTAAAIVGPAEAGRTTAMATTGATVTAVTDPVRTAVTTATTGATAEAAAEVAAGGDGRSSNPY